MGHIRRESINWHVVFKAKGDVGEKRRIAGNGMLELMAQDEMSEGLGEDVVDGLVK